MNLRASSAFLPVLAVGLLCGVAPPASALFENVTVTLQPVASGLDRPLGVTHAGDGSGRLFILEQPGRIRVVAGGQLLASPFLDLTSEVACCGERGLLGLAFHPRFGENGRFFVHYTDLGGDTVVARYRTSAADHDRADPTSRELVFSTAQPFANHNGGQLAFGPDGYLYLGLGDGGGGGDPQGNAQDLSTVLGKILRLDVDREDPGKGYAIPPGNPFAGVAGRAGEIWAYGLRNPWRFSFDRASGDLFIGDVGQSAWEEIDFQPATSPGGENYGWNTTEGDHCYGDPGCAFAGITRPILEYPHSEGCSVTGGFRYRGLGSPALAGAYLFGDYCSGTLWGALPAGAGGAWRAETLLATGVNISSFGEDEAGEVYLVEYAAQGKIHRILASGPPPPPCAADALCLGTGDRFEVRAAFLTPGGVAGAGTPVRLTPDSGSFWFFDPANIEVLVKVLDACTPFDRVWTFSAGLTNVEVELTVRDTATGAERIYRNPQGRPYPPILDTQALAVCP